MGKLPARILCLSFALVLASAKATVASAEPAPAEKKSGECRKIPRGKRVLKVSFKPDTEVSELVSWMSGITCANFVAAGQLLQGKKVTLHTPGLLTPEEAYELFIGALDSVGLAVEPEVAPGKRRADYLRIVEKRKR